jgi:molybdopterin-binding protein
MQFPGKALPQDFRSNLDLREAIPTRRLLCQEVNRSVYTCSMSLSARNQLQGVVNDIQLGGVMAHVTVRVGDNVVESVITRRSVEEMKLKKGDHVKAVIKSTEVMLLKD